MIGGLWPLVFVVAPGCFLPLEQEVGRALAHRRAQGIGGGPIIRRAAPRGGVGHGRARRPRSRAPRPARRAPLQGQRAASSCASRSRSSPTAFQHLTRGTLSGNGRFGPYGIILGAEGMIRLAPALILAVAGVDNPVCVRPLPRDPARDRERVRAARPARPPAARTRGAVVGAVGEPRVPAHAARSSHRRSATRRSSSRSILAPADDRGAVGGVHLRVLPRPHPDPPVPGRAGRAAARSSRASCGAGEHDDFRTGLRKLSSSSSGSACSASSAASRSARSPARSCSTSSIDRVDLALLCAGSGAFILALTLAQALIALMGHAKATVSWAVGIAIGAATLVILSTVDVELFLRVELSFLFASLGAALDHGRHAVPAAQAGRPRSECRALRRADRARAARDLATLEPGTVPSPSLRVAVDATPLLGTRTGVARLRGRDVHRPGRPARPRHRRVRHHLARP